MCEQKLAPNLPYMKSLFLGWFEPLCQKIEQDQELCRKGKHKAAYAPYFDLLPGDKMAVITMHKIMRSFVEGSGATINISPEDNNYIGLKMIGFPLAPHFHMLRLMVRFPSLAIGELCPPKEADVTGLLIRDGDLDTIVPVIHRRRMEKLLGFIGASLFLHMHNFMGSLIFPILETEKLWLEWSSFHSSVGPVRTYGGNKGKEHEKFQREEWFGRMMRFRNDAIIILSIICLQLLFELAYAHLYESIGSDVVKFGLTASLASQLHDTLPGVGESDGEFKKTKKVSSPADLMYKEDLLFPGRLIKDAGNVKVGGDLHKTIKPSRLKELKEMFPNENFLLSCGQRWTDMVLEDNATGEDALREWLVAAYASNMEENVSKWDHLQDAYEKMKVVMRTLLPEIQAKGWHTDRFLDGKEMGEIKLLGTIASPFVNRVQFVLNLKSIEYEFIEENLTLKSELLLTSNPLLKKVPVLLHANKPPICESLIIIEYLDEIQPNVHKILPPDPSDRANIRLWAHYIDNKFSPLFHELMQTPGKEGKEAAKNKIIKGSRLLEEAFVKFSNGKAYFGGDYVGYLDVVLGCFLCLTKIVEKENDFKVFDEVRTPILAQWADRIWLHEAIKRDIPREEIVLKLCLLKYRAPRVVR
ncbi:hypothetical protein L2E82_42845 [Cichorium intybus]|uniref:Uncharacterized protein n=1 Tax=Cichorium intybus TaxID=13427 RepID=A0ACB8ZMQ6_CICIN|nr:hypothetical protein L2E82_42845 [Cichorium intybus]